MTRLALLFALSTWLICAQSVTCPGTVGPTGESTSATTGTWTSYVNGVSGAAYVYFATWSTEDGQDDIVWYPATQIAGTTNWQANINLANHRVGSPDYGLIEVQVWAYPSSGSPTYCGHAGFERVSSAPGTATQVVLPSGTVQASSNSTLNYYACGVTNASAVLFPTWTDANQDDIVWYAGDKVYNDANCPANTWGWKATLNFADHKPGQPNYGPVSVTVYGFDSPYQPTLLGWTNFQWQPTAMGARRNSVAQPPPPMYYLMNDTQPRTWSFKRDNGASASYVDPHSLHTSVSGVTATLVSTNGINFDVQLTASRTTVPGPCNLTFNWLYGGIVVTLTVFDAVDVYDATPSVSSLQQYSPDPTGAFYVSLYGTNFGPVAGSLSVCSDSTSSCSDFQVSYSAQYSTWTDTQVNVLLPPLTDSTSDTYETQLTSLGESGAAFFALAGQSAAQSNKQQVRVPVPTFASFLRADSASGFNYAVYCPDAALGAFGIETFQIFDQSHEPFPVGGLVVQENVTNIYVTVAGMTMGPEREVGWVSAQSDPTGSGVPIVVPTTPSGTFIDGPFGGCGPLVATNTQDHQYRVQFRNVWRELSPIFHISFTLLPASVMVSAPPFFSWNVGR